MEPKSREILNLCASDMVMPFKPTPQLKGGSVGDCACSLNIKANEQLKTNTHLREKGGHLAAT